MIYKITFEDGREDYCTAKDQLHLIKSYDKDFYLPLQEIESIEEISEYKAKTIMVKNTEFESEISLYKLENSEEFEIIASNEFD